MKPRIKKYYKHYSHTHYSRWHNPLRRRLIVWESIPLVKFDGMAVDVAWLEGWNKATKKAGG